MEKIDVSELSKITDLVMVCNNRITNIECQNFNIRVSDMKMKIDALERKIDKLIYDLAIRR